MKLLILVGCICFFAACGNRGGAQVSTDTAPVNKDTQIHFTDTVEQNDPLSVDPDLENRIMDTLMELPFVKESHRYIDSFSHYKHGMAFMMDATDEGISVRAGYNGSERFETYYIFEVDPGDLTIRVFDSVEGEFISVEDYIKIINSRTARE